MKDKYTAPGCARLGHRSVAIHQDDDDFQSNFCLYDSANELKLEVVVG